MEMTEHIKCFVQGRIDENWVWKIVNRVGPWVAQKGNSGYWDCVNIYSQYTSILKKGLIRIDFAGLIVAIRPKGLKEGKTREQLKNSMDQCPVSLKLEKIETYAEDSERGKIIKELKDAVAGTDLITGYERISINNGKTYCGHTTTLSIEQYASEMFMNKNMPSSIFIIECIEENVSDYVIYKMACHFSVDRKIKLVIAAQSGFDEQVKRVALENDVRLIRVNPKYEITESDILTPRMDCGDSVYDYEHKMLSDIVPMTVPLVIQDGTYTTTSLTDFLKRNGIPVNNPGSAHAPKLTRDFIEEMVSQIIKTDVDTYVYLLKRCGVNDNVPYCIIDPYQYAKRDKLFSNPDILPDFELTAYRSVNSAMGIKTEFPDWFSALKKMENDICQIEFDIALLGCGAYGMNLGAFIKRDLGKMALHLGGMTQLLFGIRGRRWENDPKYDALYTDSWTRPLPHEIPPANNRIENGCYW